ncbi:hypothetical protein G6F50_015535 [Rhizopus delemar]|uniref:Uncharacterized protein n=1 Tax=Rhizopus delemar TaxID=936053 RepID=A0A9P6XX97_9FUNG|nr:hypothetical protein G6F50_015535 [Rhizopus delemar]
MGVVGPCLPLVCADRRPGGRSAVLPAVELAQPGSSVALHGQRTATAAARVPAGAERGPRSARRAQRIAGKPRGRTAARTGTGAEPAAVPGRRPGRDAGRDAGLRSGRPYAIPQSSRRHVLPAPGHAPAARGAPRHPLAGEDHFGRRDAAAPPTSKYATTPGATLS